MTYGGCCAACSRNYSFVLLYVYWQSDSHTRKHIESCNCLEVQSGVKLMQSDRQLVWVEILLGDA